MFYFVHVLAGAVIAKFFPNFLIIIILSLLSHLAIDIIPHKDSLFTKEIFKRQYKINIKNKEVFLELANIFVTVLLIIFIQAKFNSLLMLFSIFISLLPDILRIGYLTGLRNNKIFKKFMLFHSGIQKEVSWTLGLTIQLITTLLLLKILF